MEFQVFHKNYGMGEDENRGLRERWGLAWLATLYHLRERLLDFRMDVHFIQRIVWRCFRGCLLSKLLGTRRQLPRTRSSLKGMGWLRNFFIQAVLVLIVSQ